MPAAGAVDIDIHLYSACGRSAIVELKRWRSERSPEAIAVEEDLELSPREGASYSFDGKTIVYDLLLPLAQQRAFITRALAVHFLRTRLRHIPKVDIWDAAKRLFPPKAD